MTHEKEIIPEVPQALIERGESALYPFVEAWHLPLNPENLELMAFAVLKHAMAEGETNHEAIITDVRQLIEEDAEEHARMQEAWQRSIDLTNAFGIHQDALIEHIRSSMPDASETEVTLLAWSLIPEATAFMQPTDPQTVFQQAISVFDSYQT